MGGDAQNDGGVGTYGADADVGSLDGRSRLCGEFDAGLGVGTEALGHEVGAGQRVVHPLGLVRVDARHGRHARGEASLESGLGILVGT